MSFVLFLLYIYISKRYLKVCYKLIFRPFYIIRSLISSAANHKNIGMLTKTHVFNSLLKADFVSICFNCSGIEFHNSEPWTIKLLLNKDELVLGIMIFLLMFSLLTSCARYSGSPVLLNSYIAIEINL